MKFTKQVDDVLGFLMGGINRVEQHYNISVTSTAYKLVLWGLSIMLIPLAYARYSGRALTPCYMTFRFHPTDQCLAVNGVELKLSHATSIVLLVIYGFFLIFQLTTHSTMFDAPSLKVKKRRTKFQSEATIRSIAEIGSGIASRGGQGNPVREPEDENDLPQLSSWTAIFAVCISVGLIGMSSMCLLDSAVFVMQRYSISGSFVRFSAG